MISLLGARTLAEWLWGYDCFLSHRHAAAHTYASALRRALGQTPPEPELRAFQDRSPDGFRAGGSYDSEARRAVRASTVLVVLVEESVFASDSEYVPDEVARFYKRGKNIISIDLDGSLSRAKVDPAFRRNLPGSKASADTLELLLKRIWIDEPDRSARFPSPDVVTKLKGSLDSETKTVRRMRLLTAVLMVLAVFLGWALVSQIDARRSEWDSWRSSARSQSSLAESLALSAKNAIGSADILTAARNIREARSTAPTPFVLAQALQMPPLPVTLDRAVPMDDLRVLPVTFHPRRPLLVMGTGEGNIRFSELPEGASRELKNPLPVVDLAFPADGRELYAVVRRYPDAAWNKENNRSRQPPDASALLRVELDPEPRTTYQLSASAEHGFTSVAAAASVIVVGTDKGPWILERDSLAKVRELPWEGKHPPVQVAISPAGEYVAAASALGAVAVYSARDGARIGGFVTAQPQQPFAYVRTGLAFHPDRPILATGSIREGARIWRFLEESEPAAAVGSADGTNAVHFFDKGRQLAIAQWNGEIELVDVDGLRTVTRVRLPRRGLQAGVLDIAFSGGEQFLAASYALPLSADGSASWMFGKPRVWQIAVPPTLPQDFSNRPVNFAWNKEGRLTAWAANDALRLNVWHEGSEVQEIPSVQGRFFSAANRMALDGEKPVLFLRAGPQAWEATGRLACRVNGSRHIGSSDLSPSGSRLVLITGKPASNGEWFENLEALIVDLDSKDILVRQPIPIEKAVALGPVRWRPDGLAVALGVVEKSAAQDEPRGSRVYLWRLDDNNFQELLDWKQRNIASLAWDPFGQRLALGDDSGQVAVLDTATGKMSNLLEELAGGPLLVSFSANGRYLVALGLARFHVWQLGSEPWKKEDLTVTTKFFPTSIDATPDGRAVVIGDASGHLQFWELESGELLSTVKAHEGAVASVRVSPDGRRLLSMAADGVRFNGGTLDATKANDHKGLKPNGQRVASNSFPEGNLQLPARDLNAWQADPAAARFWKLQRAGGNFNSPPTAWLGWLWTGHPATPRASGPLAEWIEENPKHPLAGVVPWAAYREEIESGKQTGRCCDE